MSGNGPGGPPIPVQHGISGQPFQFHRYLGPGQQTQEQHQQQQGIGVAQGGYSQSPSKAVPSGGSAFPLERGRPPQYGPPPSGLSGEAIPQTSSPFGSSPPPPQSIAFSSANVSSPPTAPPMHRSPVLVPGLASGFASRPGAAAALLSSSPPRPNSMGIPPQHGSSLAGGLSSVPGSLGPLPMTGSIGPSPGLPGASGPYQQHSHPSVSHPSFQQGLPMGPPPAGRPPTGLPPKSLPPTGAPPTCPPSLSMGPASTGSSTSGPPRPAASPFMVPPSIGPPPMGVPCVGPQSAGPPSTTGLTGSSLRYPGGPPQQTPSFGSVTGTATALPPPPPSTTLQQTDAIPPRLVASPSFEQRGYLQLSPYGPTLVQAGTPAPPPLVGILPGVPIYGAAEGMMSAVSQPPIQEYGDHYSAVPAMPYGLPASARAAGYYQGAGQYGYGGPMQRQALIEEFQSLSITPPPGSLDAGVDPSQLPRPLDEEDSLPQSVSSVNCHPKFMRLTCNAIPNSQSLRSRWHLPLGAFIHPLAKPPPGEEVPVVNFGAVIVRCRSCRTYINPFATFTDGGRRWRCNICSLLNEVPLEYFCQLGPDGRRRDTNERPELLKGCVEFVAPAEYMVRPPMPPVYFFLIDVSQPAVASGMLQVAVETIRASLDNLPGDSRVQLGFLAFDSTLHFINLKASLAQPQMLVVADLEDPFLPILDDLIVYLSESRSVVEALLSSLPSMYHNTTNIESALGPALQVTFSVMSQLGGKLLVFQSSLPSLGAGRLKLRGEDYRIYGTDREHFLRVAEDQFYKRMAADCYRVQISVNMYCFSDQYTDIASLGTLAKYTGGQVFYYPAFCALRDGERFKKELMNDLIRETGWEAVMRIRCGKGLRISSYHGHFFIRSTDLLALPAVDADKACVIQISHDDTILSTSTTYVQSALLYTASCGERRIRVHTCAVPVVDNLGDMYRAVDLGTTVTALAKIAVEKSYNSRLEEVRTMVQQKCVAALREYRSLYAVQHHTAGRLIFPDTLRLLPLYALALCKSPVLRGGFMEVLADERSFNGYEVMNMSVERVLRLLYPTLRRLDDMSPECGTTGKDGKIILPATLPLSAEKLDAHGVYLVEDGLKMYMWVGSKAPSDFLEQVLELEVVGMEDSNATNVVLPRKDNIVSQRVNAIVDSRREGMVVQPPCLIVRSGQRCEAAVQPMLVEDRMTSEPSYMEWVISVYKQVQQKG